MAQILQGNDLGQRIGAGLGGGISEGLQQLAHEKMTRIAEKNRYERNLSGLKALGVPNAEQLAHFDEHSLQQIVKNKLQEPSEQAYAQSLQSLRGEQPQPVQRQEAQSALQSIAPEQRQLIEQYLNSPEGQQSGSPEEIQKLREALAMPSGQQGQPAGQELPGQPPAPQRLTERQATELTKLSLEKQKMTAAEKRQEKQFEHDRRKEALKETKEIRKELFAKKKAAQETIESINQFEELEKEGLPSAGYMELLKNSGLDIPALVGAPGEEYNKIAANFVRNAKAIFGNRLTDTDLEQFLKTVPSLANSPEGRKRINANLKRVANLDKAAVDAYEDIVQSNGGFPPDDLDLKLDKALDKKREAVYKQFKKDLEKEVPQGESPYVTALLAGAGKLVGRIPSALKGAATGAATGAFVGSRGGPIGALGGAALGGLAGLGGFSVKDLL